MKGRKGRWVMQSGQAHLYLELNRWLLLLMMMKGQVDRTHRKTRLAALSQKKSCVATAAHRHSSSQANLTQPRLELTGPTMQAKRGHTGRIGKTTTKPPPPTCTCASAMQLSSLSLNFPFSLRFTVTLSTHSLIVSTLSVHSTMNRRSGACVDPQRSCLLLHGRRELLRVDSDNLFRLCRTRNKQSTGLCLDLCVSVCVLGVACCACCHRNLANERRRCVPRRCAIPTKDRNLDFFLARFSDYIYLNKKN